MENLISDIINGAIRFMFELAGVKMDDNDIKDFTSEYQVWKKRYKMQDDYDLIQEHNYMKVMYGNKPRELIKEGKYRALVTVMKERNLLS